VSLKFSDYGNPLQTRTRVHEFFIPNFENFGSVFNVVMLELNKNDVILIDSPFQNPFKEEYDLETSYLNVEKSSLNSIEPPADK
jgi:hypothetical protein